VTTDKKMRVSKKDKAEYTRLKNNVKNKIKRVQKQHNLDLSGLIELPDLNSFTRKGFNSWKEEAAKFSSRVNKVKKNEFGVPYTNQLVNEYKRRADKANEIKDKFNKVFENVPLISGGKPTGMSVAVYDMLMKDADDLGNKTPQKFEIDKIKDLRGLEKKMKRIDEEQDIQSYLNDMSDMQKNWIEGMEKVFNSAADSLVNKIKLLPPAIFYELYKSTKELQFDYWYPDDAESDMFDETVSYIEEQFDNNFRDKELMLLKDFPDKW
jgi:hypothetical protein